MMRMENKVMIPEGYQSKLDIRETEIAIKLIKDRVEEQIADSLNLTRVSAPLFVRRGTGINDDLNGVERPVRFDIRDIGSDVEVVHSLAKWKRMALARYGFSVGEGLYTDMNAIRRDEELDNLHSVYVDQWDWEKVISREQRTRETLESIVREIYACLRRVENHLIRYYPMLERKLPDEITFITSQELLDLYPDLPPKAREDAICRRHRAVFVIQIGDRLSDGKPHDGRAPDYDDWQLNGDILFYYPTLDRAFEISSMGIRVDETSMRTQLEKAGVPERAQFEFHRLILSAALPYTVGGGIGQSRLCMFYLDKAHIGEVQSSDWPDGMQELCARNGMYLL